MIIIYANLLTDLSRSPSGCDFNHVDIAVTLDCAAVVQVK